MVDCKLIAEALFSYETPKIVLIKNFYVGVVSRLVQILILAYIIGYVIIIKKGYQQFSHVESAVTTKVKGVAYTNFSNDLFNIGIEHPEWYKRIWDVSDYVVPPSENGATFITTNVIITSNQTQGKCPEDPTIDGAECDRHQNNCTVGYSFPTGNGVMTGRCIKLNDKSDKHTCEIQAWCPLEADILPLKNNTPLLQASKKFTILIKNFVDFPLFKHSHRRNIKETADPVYLQSCHYDPESNKECPIFVLEDIVKWSGQDFESIAYKGGIIAVIINWECDLDYDNACFPTYSFSRLDDPHAKIAPGWNFRYSHYYSDDKRTLFKMYGIRLSINVVGRAGKFHIIPLLLNVGAGLGLLALQVVIGDIVVLYVVKKRRYFYSKKYEPVDPNTENSDLSQVSTMDSPNMPPTKQYISEDYERLED